MNGDAATGAPRERYLQAFSAEPTAVQVTWGALGPGPVRLQAMDTVVDVETDGGPGAALLTGLPPATRLTVVVSGPGVPGGRRTLSAETLAALDGPVLTRLATIGDLHVGAAHFGFKNSMPDPAALEELHPIICSRAAIREAEAWGTERIVVKGDLTHDGRPFQWRWVAGVLDEAEVPVHVLAGNHDWSGRRTVDPADGLAPYGREVVDGVGTVDLPGVRLVMVDTAVPELHGGRIAAGTDDACDAVADARADGLPVLMTLHHQLQRTEIRSWPPGVHADESNRFLDRVTAANPNLLITSGHTHRHRARRYKTATITTVGSTKDFPGVWAGYEVHEDGIHQIVRRVSDPKCIKWTEYTGNGVGGLWRFIGPGRRKDRCLTVRWLG